MSTSTTEISGAADNKHQEHIPQARGAGILGVSKNHLSKPKPLAQSYHKWATGQCEGRVPADGRIKGINNREKQLVAAGPVSAVLVGA